MDLYKLVWENGTFDDLDKHLREHFSNWARRQYAVEFRRDLTPDLRKGMRHALPQATNYRISKKTTVNYLLSYDIGNRRFSCQYSLYENKIINKRTTLI